MPTIKVTDATVLPISVAEAKAHLRVDHSTDDTLIEALIGAARQDAEARLNRSIVPTTWKLLLDTFPCGQCIRLHWPTVTAVSHLKYYDRDGVQQIWDSSNYQLDGASEPARLCLDPDVTSWPDTQTDKVNAVEIQYVAGWADAAAVPAVIKAWLKLRVGTLYEHREEIAAGVSINEIPFVSNLLDGHKVWSL